MLVAIKKRKENIVEYILYFYQIENLIRAFELNVELIEKRLVPSYKTDDNTKNEIAEWYKNLVAMMEKEGIQKEGHLQFLQNLIIDVNQVHIKLIDTEIDNGYSQIFKSVAGLIGELKQKNSKAKNDVELGFDTIYGFLLLKLQSKKITEETESAVKQLIGWMNVLSKLYKEYETGDLEI